MMRPLRFRMAVAALIPTLLGGCAIVHPTVPVEGASQALAGIWQGSYRSNDAVRSGSIYFALTAEAGNRNAAVGEVVMQYVGGQASFYSPDVAPVPRPVASPAAAAVLTIRFVRVGGDRVSGSLASYHDPACGCLLETTFEGTRVGDTIEGTYAAQSREHDRVQRGTWHVVHHN